MSEWSQALSGAKPQAGSEAGSARTVSGNRGLQLEELLLFERDSRGSCGVDFPEPEPFASRLGGLERRGPVGLPGLSEPEVVRIPSNRARITKSLPGARNGSALGSRPSASRPVSVEMLS